MEQIQDTCKQVLTVLAFFEKSILKKIPSKAFINLNNLAADSKKDYYIDKRKDLLGQNISEEAKDLIALLYYTYIADGNEKNELLEIWNQNEKEYQDSLKEKYNVDNLFEKRKKESIENAEEVTSEVSLVEYKETLFKKIINKIKNILKKK